jgi:hypothetical protein
MVRFPLTVTQISSVEKDFNSSIIEKKTQNSQRATHFSLKHDKASSHSGWCRFGYDLQFMPFICTLGYIGSHTILTLLESGFDVTVVDSLVNSSAESLTRVKEITGCDPDRVTFFQVDICNFEAMEEIFKVSPKFLACIHFAGLKVN